MLNINKIESDIHRNNLESTDVSKIIEVKYSTTLDRRKKGNWAPNDIEKLADYFGRTIAYYFDREETQEKGYQLPPVPVDVVEDSCPLCEVYRDRILDLKALVASKEETIAVLRGEDKKENPSANSAQAS